MKTRNLLPVMVIFFLIFNSQETQAQDTKNFFSVTGGYSLPVGQLATEKLNDPLAGLAGSGYYGQVIMTTVFFAGWACVFLEA